MSTVIISESLKLFTDLHLIKTQIYQEKFKKTIKDLET